MFRSGPDPGLDLFLPCWQPLSSNHSLVSFSDPILKRVMVYSFSGRVSGARTHRPSWMLHCADPNKGSTIASNHSKLKWWQSVFIIKKYTYTFVGNGGWIASLSAVQVLLREVFLLIYRWFFVQVHDFIELLIVCHFLSVFCLDFILILK